MPYTDPDGPLYCPFHFMNEARSADGMGDCCNITFLEGIQVNQVICMTARTIPRGAELFVSYGDEVDRSHWDGASSSAGPDACDAADGTAYTVGDHSPRPVSPVSMPPSPGSGRSRAADTEQPLGRHRGVAHVLQTFAASPPPPPPPPADQSTR
ncbi:hypothetical protein H4R21_007161 [Coemansia helicoidea]|uniref:Uncharacterized protein n=1 Tax=Coemansia helicoidea TaxID=1286919 RepID=A0ACC1KD05_9FUNG|nr:hypothetical protein H4R21_007161 [Coemansia helicoidea]